MENIHNNKNASSLLQRILPTRLSQKLPAMFVLFAIMAGATVGAIAIYKSSAELESSYQERMIAVTGAVHHEIKGYLDSIRSDLDFTASNPMVIQAVQDFDAAWDELGGNQTEYLQRLYIEDNPHPTGSKDELDAAADGSTYSALHAAIHPWMRTFLREREYYDIFFFDTDGNLLYTVFKELDYATNLNTGKWKDSDLGVVFRDALALADSEVATFQDFEPYTPSFDAPASFIGKQVVDNQGKVVGVLVFQMPISRINGVMQSATGIGETGETFIVGADKLMRSDSRFSEESTILARTIDSEAITLAMEGKAGVVEQTVDGQGSAVMQTYQPLDFEGTRWAIVAQVTRDEIEAPVIAMRNDIIMNVIIASAVISLLGWLFARTITRRVSHISTVMDHMANDRAADVPYLGSVDLYFNHCSVAA